MKINKWLYFAAQADEAALDGSDDNICVPADSLISINPTANNRVTLSFKSMVNNNAGAGVDTVVLETVVGDAFEVANAIVRHINASVPHDGFIVVANDVTIQDPGDASLLPTYIHPSITGVNSISLANWAHTQQDVGMSQNPVLPTVTPANNGTLAVSSVYHISDVADRKWYIPSAAATRAGDWISVLYTANIAANLHRFETTTDANFYPGSVIRVPGVGNTSRVGFTDISTTNDNILAIQGHATGDGGIGTRLFFRNITGTTNGWAVEAIVEGQGAASQATADTLFS